MYVSIGISQNDSLESLTQQLKFLENKPFIYSSCPNHGCKGEPNRLKFDSIIEKINDTTILNILPKSHPYVKAYLFQEIQYRSIKNIFEIVKVNICDTTEVISVRSCTINVTTLGLFSLSIYENTLSIKDKKLKKKEVKTLIDIVKNSSLLEEVKNYLLSYLDKKR